MASKADLITAANSIAAKLGKTVETSGKTNAELQQLVSGLRAEADAAEGEKSVESGRAALVAEAKGLADELGTDVETEDKSDAELADLIANMKVGVDEAAKAALDEAGADAAKDAAADAKQVKTAKVEAAADEKKPPFYISDGCSLTCTRGVLGPGEEITAKDLPGGEASLAKHVANGHVSKG